MFLIFSSVQGAGKVRRSPRRKRGQCFLSGNKGRVGGREGRWGGAHPGWEGVAVAPLIKEVQVLPLN